MTGREHYIWFGHIKSAGATEFDYVLIPRLEIPEWAEDAETGWDWLDLAVSRARIGAYACTTKGFIPVWLEQVLEESKLTKERKIGYNAEPSVPTTIGAERGHLIFQALYQREEAQP